jgi:hypothetical protein
MDFTTKIHHLGGGFQTFRSEISAPPLPDHIKIRPNIAGLAGKWVDSYVNYSSAISPMTPRVFHESAALWLVSVVVARRLVLRMPFGDVYPNLYVLWLAPSTLFRKSTAMGIATSIAEDVFPFLLASQDTTPEALISDMAGKKPTGFEEMTSDEQSSWALERNFCAQKGWVMDEFSGLLAGLRRDYNAGMIELLLRFHDCCDTFKRSTRAQGILRVSHAYLSLFGASTPSAVLTELGANRLWTNGFWPRFIILTPDQERPRWSEAKEVDRPKILTDQLDSLFHRLPPTKYRTSPQVLEVGIAENASQTWSLFNKALSYDMLTDDLNENLYAAYGRFPTTVLKVAILLAALDWDGNGTPVIMMQHMERAIQFVDVCRLSVHRALETISSAKSDGIKTRIFGLLQKHPAGLSLRDICRNMRDRSESDLNSALHDLLRRRDVIIVKKASGKNGGRPTDIFVLP